MPDEGLGPSAVDGDVVRGIEGVEAVDEDSSNSLLPFDPRRKGPRDVLGDLRVWIGAHKLYVAGVVAAIVVLHVWLGLEVSTESLPPWGWTMLATAPVALPLSLWIGVRVGKFLKPSVGHLVSQLDGKDGQQELLRIDEERYRDLTVIDYEGTERPRDYLTTTSVNGERALECDAYYPRDNVAVAAWQAGRSNHEIRQHEHAVDLIKTEQDRAANAGLKAEMEKPQEVAAEVRKHSNVLIGAVEGVVSPGEVDLTAIADEADADRMDGSQEDHLAALEAESEHLGGGGSQSNGHRDDEPAGVDDRAAEAWDRVTSRLSDLNPRGGGGGD